MEVNNRIYNGYQQADVDGKSNEFVAAYDFSNSDKKVFNLSIWYNSTCRNDTGFLLIALSRVRQSMNMVFLTYDVQMRLKFKLMMKMHSTKRGPYWLIYAYFFYSYHFICYALQYLDLLLQVYRDL
ncbi:hypothetical protein HPP92_009508 [Vanilla planifolia]|uniref:Uncharacterized protein n=1 Tax=Vanilla planifolia TaxID=51239 RepID=A0A835RJF8_VANPL|nr:hypothetical protein HPP92_009508 [Vanilla planifolia]